MLKWMRLAACGCLSLGGFVVPVGAQPVAAPDPAASCRKLLDGTPVKADSFEALPDGGCRFTNASFGVGGRFAYQATSLVEHGLSSTAMQIPDQAIHARIEARGIGFVLHSGNPVMDWVNRQQQVPFDVVADFAYDPASGRATLGELSMSGAAIGHTKLSGEADLPRDAPPANVAIGKLTLHMDSRRLIPVFLLYPLAGTGVLPPDDPDAEVAAYKKQAAATLRALLPAAGASPQTVDALVRFVADFPHPDHVLDLNIAATPPLTMDAVTQDASDPVTLLKSLAITATYDGQAH